MEQTSNSVRGMYAMLKVAYNNIALFCICIRIEFKLTEGHKVGLPQPIFELIYNS